jgi:K+-sensing histidine kinase KdpD
MEDKFIYLFIAVIFILTVRDELKEKKRISKKILIKACLKALLMNGIFYSVLYFIISVLSFNLYLIFIPPFAYFGYQLLEKSKK